MREKVFHAAVFAIEERDLGRYENIRERKSHFRWSAWKPIKQIDIAPPSSLPRNFKAWNFFYFSFSMWFFSYLSLPFLKSFHMKIARIVWKECLEDVEKQTQTSSIIGHKFSRAGGVCCGPFSSLHSVKNWAMPW